MVDVQLKKAFANSIINVLNLIMYNFEVLTAKLQLAHYKISRAITVTQPSVSINQPGLVRRTQKIYQLWPLNMLQIIVYEVKTGLCMDWLIVK